MSTWPESTRYRLAYEEKLLKQEVPHFYFLDRAQAGHTTVRGTYISSSEKTYTLCVRLRIGYPHALPGLYILYPEILYDYYGNTIQSYQTSHSMHVWTPDWNNYVKICHWKQEFWSAENTILTILLKGFLWIEAYELHLRTGKNIDAYSRDF